ncbi:hypothetical protein H9Y04_33235 [Streptomyces sp. TRM66268-LWL]|uniref:Roadblock/LAMTOR2 domain-containing protein n=1 Tax=Streptomyces polyasparticus TaxID=2767826 RepID=A0ABR7SPJ3_9ACTN|nr:hypothetical protein [Streptomyces polyasparticus]MBC9717405.1 hypothetical protein [Streptomyces polyasparticus]
MPGIDMTLVEAMSVHGARGATIVDWTCGFVLDSAGEAWPAGVDATAADTAELARLVRESAAFCAAHDGGEPTTVEDVIVTTGSAYHLICFVPEALEGGVLLHLWLDRESGNLALARRRLRALAEELAQPYAATGAR